MAKSSDILTDDALAMLYLADELSPTDRDAFAVRLAAEELLRRRVDALSATQASLFDTLDRVDAASPVPSAWAAAHEIGRHAATLRSPARPRGPRVPRWIGVWMLYPAGAAALVALGLYAWWNNVQDDSTPKPYDGPRLLSVSDGASRDPSAMSDAQIEAQFEPMVLDYDSRIRRSLQNLDYLEQTLP